MSALTVMIGAAVRALYPKRGNRPLGSVRPLPDSVREIARGTLAPTRPISAFPLVDANGVPWHERKRREQEEQA